MTTQVIQLYNRERYSGSYEFTITQEPDEDFRKYLGRKLRDTLPFAQVTHPADSTPLDISLDDIEGDVVAGISAVTVKRSLHIDMLWVDVPLRRNGIGRRLVQMAEEMAVDRGCDRARITVMGSVEFYIGLGYSLVGTVQPVLPRPSSGKVIVLPGTQAIYTLVKELS